MRRPARPSALPSRRARPNARRATDPLRALAACTFGIAASTLECSASRPPTEASAIGRADVVALAHRAPPPVALLTRTRNATAYAADVAAQAAAEAPAVGASADAASGGTTRAPTSVDSTQPAPADARGGRCVIDPIDDALRRWDDPLRRGETVTHADFAIEALSDLDDDGTPDRAVYAPAKGCGLSNCWSYLYLSGKGCASYAGADYFETGSVVVLLARHGGAYDIRVWSNDGCAGMRGRVMYLRRLRGRYVRTHSIACGCPDDAPNAYRPRACGRD